MRLQALAKLYLSSTDVGRQAGKSRIVHSNVSIPYSGEFGTRLGWISVETVETSALPGFGIGMPAQRFVRLLDISRTHHRSRAAMMWFAR